MKPPETLYRGGRTTDAAGGITTHVAVFERGGVRGRPLALQPSMRLRNHSPTGFEWGYGGSGPSQLALALLLDATGDRDFATRCYHWFKWAVVACWGETWQITAGEIRGWVERWEREERQREEATQVIEPYQLPATCNVAEGGAR